MGRAPCCEKVGLNRGPWTREEDMKLIQHITAHGEGSWRTLPKAAGLLRCGKSCRLRWINYLRPDLKRGNITEEEDMLIIKLHSVLGNRWSLIAGRMPGRTDNEIKNYWNTHLKKKLRNMGIDPQTHQPLQNSRAVNDAHMNTILSKQQLAVAAKKSCQLMYDSSTLMQWLPLETDIDEAGFLYQANDKNPGRSSYRINRTDSASSSSLTNMEFKAKPLPDMDPAQLQALLKHAAAVASAHNAAAAVAASTNSPNCPVNARPACIMSAPMNVAVPMPNVSCLRNMKSSGSLNDSVLEVSNIVSGAPLMTSCGGHRHTYTTATMKKLPLATATSNSCTSYNNVVSSSCKEVLNLLSDLFQCEQELMDDHLYKTSAAWGYSNATSGPSIDDSTMEQIMPSSFCEVTNADDDLCQKMILNDVSEFQNIWDMDMHGNEHGANSDIHDDHQADMNDVLHGIIDFSSSCGTGANLGSNAGSSSSDLWTGVEERTTCTAAAGDHAVRKTGC